MAAEPDYKALGLKCGLECHQQLNTGKLFSRCKGELTDAKPDLVVKRKLRPILSELGEYDPAALEAFQRDLTFVYEAFRDHNSLVELDEEPPQPMDEEALHTALEVAAMLKTHPLDQIHVMRKLIIDGSTTTSFQRTALIATDGHLDVNGKRIGVYSIVLEEDSARPVKREGKEVVYRLDRLGIPLIELSTSPDIESPEEAKEVALKLGELFRLTGKARRGLGSIRQDVNVSIKGGARIELKGVQDLALMDEYIRREITRQLALIALKEELQKRGAKKEALKPGAVKLDAAFKGTGSALAGKALKDGLHAYGVRLPGFAGLMGKEVQPARRFGTEIASELRARHGIKGVVHGDELPGYGISSNEVEAVKKLLGCAKNDSLAFVFAGDHVGPVAVNIIVERCRQAFDGVPGETRNALPDGNSEYLRPISGRARMYPETDLYPFAIDGTEWERVKKNLPYGKEERLALYTKKFGLSGKLAEEMVLDNFARFFERLAGKGVDATLAASTLLQGLTALRRNGKNVGALTEKILEDAFDAVKRGALSKDVLLAALANWTEKPVCSLEEIIAEMRVEKAGAGEAEEIVRRLVEKNRSLVEKQGEHAIRALMGDAMKELRGKVSGQELSALLKKEIQAVQGD